LTPDAEVKILGWWGRLEQLTVGDRVWVWLKTDRKKLPVAISMIADEISQQDINGAGLTIEKMDKGFLTLKPAKGPSRVVELGKAPFKVEVGKDGSAEVPPKVGDQVYVQTTGKQARVFYTTAGLEQARQQQKANLRGRWTKEGLPGTVGFVHVFSGEMELVLDHETMRWARALKTGDAVTLEADPPIKAVVKHQQPWRERTQLRLVVYSFDLADLSPGQRLHLKCTPPATDIETSVYPPDIDRTRTKQERVEWFLASIYCTCKVAGDRCTGHFYTLASCNPNGCGMPNHMRRVVTKKIDAGLTDRQIFDELLKEHGPTLLRPHLLP
jgi:hypothetical protein